MHCPVCGEALRSAAGILRHLPARLASCGDCRPIVLDKGAPPPESGVGAEPCDCGRRPIDVVMAAVHRGLVEAGCLAAGAPLRAAGTPLLHPSYPMRRAPCLLPASLILLSSVVTPDAASRLLAAVPELKAVVRDESVVPGIRGATHSLLAGCDVYAECRFTPAGPLILYKQASTCHIEAPRPVDPKLAATERALRRHGPEVFVDACAGPGTLGLYASLRQIPAVVLNDRWYAAAAFSALNLWTNQAALGLDEVVIHRVYDDLRGRPLRDDPVLVAEGSGVRKVSVYQGSCWALPARLPSGRRLAALDPFSKDPALIVHIIEKWEDCAGGEVFIP